MPFDREYPGNGKVTKICAILHVVEAKVSSKWEWEVLVMFDPTQIRTHNPKNPIYQTFKDCQFPTDLAIVTGRYSLLGQLVGPLRISGLQTSGDCPSTFGLQIG
jgi:hypothetical protein